MDDVFFGRKVRIAEKTNSLLCEELETSYDEIFQKTIYRGEGAGTWKDGRDGQIVVSNEKTDGRT